MRSLRTHKQSYNCSANIMYQPTYPDCPRLCVSLWLCASGHLVLKVGELLEFLHGILEALCLGQLLRGGSILIGWLISRTACGRGKGRCSQINFVSACRVA